MRDLASIILAGLSKPTRVTKIGCRLTLYSGEKGFLYKDVEKLLQDYDFHVARSSANALNIMFGSCCSKLSTWWD